MAETFTSKKRLATDIGTGSASPMPNRRRLDGEQMCVALHESVGCPSSPAAVLPSLTLECLAVEEKVHFAVQVLCDPIAKCVRWKAADKQWMELLSWRDVFHEISVQGAQVRLGRRADLRFRSVDEAESFVASAVSLRMGTARCAICCEEVAADACSVSATCRHRFCTLCIDTWSTMCSRCPLCRCEMELLIRALPDDGPARQVPPKSLGDESDEEPDPVPFTGILQLFVLVATTYVVTVMIVLYNLPREIET